MKQAQLYVWSVLRSMERVDDDALSRLAQLGATHLSIADKEQRRLDMEAAAGAWAERTDLPDSSTYIADLRDHVRDLNEVCA